MAWVAQWDLCIQMTYWIIIPTLTPPKETVKRDAIHGQSNQGAGDPT